MKIHDATEIAYKNGYEDGMRDAVKHGRWIHASNKPGVWIGMKCSLCGARIKYSEYTNGNHNYCHKCGAKMDGDGNA